MPVDIDELVRLGSGKTTTTEKPQANKTALPTKVKTDIQTVDDLANIGAGKEVKKKVGSEETATDISKEVSTSKLSEDAIQDIGVTLGNDFTPNGKATEVQFANIPKPLTTQQKLEQTGKNIVAKQETTKRGIDVFNNSYGTKYNPQEVLSDPDKASDFLNEYRKKVAKADFHINSRLQPANIIASSESFGQPIKPSKIDILPDVELLSKATQNESLLADKVVDLTNDEKRLKGLTQKQAINNLHKRLDPQGFERIKKAFDDRTDVSAFDFITGNNPLTKDNAKDFELLNTEKAPYELLLNESLKRQANDRITIGTLQGNQALINDGKSLQAQVRSDDDIYATYPTLNKSRIAAEISQELAAKTGQLKGSDAEGLANVINKFRGQADPFNTEAFDKYYSNPKTRDAALEVAANPDEYISDPSFLGGIYKNISKPFKELGLSALDIVGVRDKMDRLSDAKNEELFPEITPELKGYVSKIKGAINTTGYLTGMMALQIPGTGLGTALGLEAKGAGRVGTSMAFGIPGMDTNLKDADRFSDNDGVKALYATFGAMLNTVGGEFLELGKISKFGELQKPILELANKMTDKNITEKAVSELLDKAKNPYVDALMKYGTNVTKGAAVMSYFTFANGVNRMLFGGEGTTKDLVENTGTAFVDGLLGMSVLGAFGAHADMAKEKNTSWKQSFKTMVDNHDATRDVIETSYRNGQIDRPTYNEKISILNTAIAAKNNLDIAESGANVKLDESQKAVYVTNRTAEGVIKKQLESPLLTEEQNGTFQAQIKRLQTQREDILKGLTFSDNLEPLNEIFEAQKEYKQAYENFNEGVVENDSEVLKAKERLIKANEDYKQSLIPESVKEKNRVDAETKLAKENADIELAKKEELAKNEELTGKSVSDTEILPTFERVKKVVPEERLTATQDILTRVNKAESINEKEIEIAQDELYSALDAAPEAAHLIEPLILKLQDYEFTTKTETSTVTEKEPTGTTVKVKKEIKPALEQSTGSEATITRSDGTTDKGILNITDGNYTLTVEGKEPIIIGEKAITDRDLKLPDEQRVPEPIQFDENSNVKSVTFETRDGNLVTIENHEKALDIAIQLQADAIGEIPDAAFEQIYKEVQKEIQVEVPSKDISSQSKTETDGKSSKSVSNGKEGSEGGGKETTNEGKNDGKEGDVSTTANPLNEGTVPEKETGAAPSKEPPKPPSDTEGEPKNDDEGTAPQRKFTKQVLADENILPKAEIAKKLDYVRQKNAMSIEEADKIISDVGVDEAFDLVVYDKDVKPAVRVVLGQMLIKKFNNLAAKAKDEETRNYYIDKTIEAADYVTEKLATEPGQMIQAFSLYGRLSPEAQMRSAIKDVKKQAKKREQKRANDVAGIGDKLKKVNEETADEITKDKDIDKSIDKAENNRQKKAKERIKNAQQKRADIIKKYNENKGKNLYSGFGLTNEGIEFVGDIAKTYIIEGIGKAELLIEKIREHLEDISKKPITDEVAKQIEHIANIQINNSDIKSGMSEIGGEINNQKLKINEIIKSHFSVADAAKKSLSEKLIKEAGLDGEDAKDLAKTVHEAFDKIANAKKQNILLNEKAKFDRIYDQLGGAKKTTKKEIQDDIIKYSNLGAFDNDHLLDMLSEKLGTGALTPEQGKEIQRLAEKIEKAPEGSPKNDAVQDLLAYRANIKGTSWAEVSQGVWYANVLSGYLTHIRNIVSTFYNGFSFFAVEAARNPASIPALLYGAAKGLKRGAVEALHTIRTGRSPIHVSKVETPQVLERMNFKGGLLNPANYLKYVGRLMVAEDVLQFQGLKEMRATQLAYGEANKMGYKNPFNKKVWKVVNDNLLYTPQRYVDAQQQVKKEGLTGVEGKRRFYELMEQSRPIQVQEDSYGFAAKGTFNHETEGTLGALSNAVSQILDVEVGGAKPLRFLVPFTRILTNVANNTLDFSPIGLIRAARGVRGFESFEKSHIVKSQYHVMTKEERQQTIVKASLGIASMAALYTLSSNGTIQVSGAGPTDIKKKLQLIQEGWQPYSIKIGDTYYSYKLTPMVFAWGIVGSIRDHEQYDKGVDEETMAQRTALATWDGIKSIADMTWVGSAAPLLGAIAASNPGEAKSILSNTGRNIGKGFLLPSLYTQTAEKIEQIYNMPQKQVNGFFQSLITNVPIARNTLNDKINALGDPIVKDVDILSSNETTDPTWKYLLDKKGWVAPVNKNTLIIYDDKISQDRPVTEDEYYEFSKVRGHKIKEAIKNIMMEGAYTTENEKGETVVTTNEEISTGNIPAQQLTSSQLNKLLTPIKTKATKETKKELFLKDAE